jgi:hypothetical protein
MMTPTELNGLSAVETLFPDTWTTGRTKRLIILSEGSDYTNNRLQIGGNDNTANDSLVGKFIIENHATLVGAGGRYGNSGRSTSSDKEGGDGLGGGDGIQIRVRALIINHGAIYGGGGGGGGGGVGGPGFDGLYYSCNGGGGGNGENYQASGAARTTGSNGQAGGGGCGVGGKGGNGGVRGVAGANGATGTTGTAGNPGHAGGLGGDPGVYIWVHSSLSGQVQLQNFGTVLGTKDPGLTLL